MNKVHVFCDCESKDADTRWTNFRLAPSTVSPATRDELELVELAAEDRSAPVTELANTKVLCVGGRLSNVPRYRVEIEGLGARFDFHDGGLEQSHQSLESSLAAADWVICQTGCISHNSYWRVKSHCRRTGKKCVYVDNPSSSSLSLQLDRQRFLSKID